MAKPKTSSRLQLEATERRSSARTNGVVPLSMNGSALAELLRILENLGTRVLNISVTENDEME